MSSALGVLGTILGILFSILLIILVAAAILAISVTVLALVVAAIYAVGKSLLERHQDKKLAKQQMAAAEKIRTERPDLAEHPSVTSLESRRRARQFPSGSTE